MKEKPKEEVEKSCSNCEYTGTKWWQRLLLPFCRTKISVDIASSPQDYSVACYYKVLFKRVHVIKFEKF